MENNNSVDGDAWVDERMAALAVPEAWQPDVSTGLARLQQSREAARHRTRAWVCGVAALAAACVLLVAVPTTRVFAQRCLNACVAPFFPLKAVPAGMPAQAPDFSLKDANGTLVRLSDYKGKVVVLNFWATWCPPCLKEIPWFVEFQRTYRDAGLVVLGVSMDEDGWKSVKPFLETTEVNYPMVVGTEEVSELYGGVEGLPSTFMIDRSGKIVGKHAGLVSRGVYEREIAALLK